MALLGSGLILATERPILHGLSRPMRRSSNSSMPLLERNMNNAKGVLSFMQLTGDESDADDDDDDEEIEDDEDEEIEEVDDDENVPFMATEPLLVSVFVAELVLMLFDGEDGDDDCCCMLIVRSRQFDEADDEDDDDELSSW